MLKRRRVRELADRYREIVELPRLEPPAFHLPSLHMVMETFPMDHKLPWLLQLTSRDQASRLLENILGQPVEDLRTKILSYRAAKKLGLKYQFLLPGADAQDLQVTVKAWSRSTLDALSYHKLMTQLCKSAEGTVRLEATLGCWPEFNLILSAWVPGQRLGKLEHDTDFLKHVSAAAETLAHFHALPFPDTPRRSPPQDMAAKVRDFIPSLEAWHPKGALMIRRLGDELAKALEELPATFAPTHGDFHMDNVIVGEEIAFIDLYTFSLSDPLRDLGSFLGHHRFPFLSRRRRILDTKAEEIFLAKYFSVRPDSERRMRLYQAAGMFMKATVPFKRQLATRKEQVELRLVEAEHALRQAKQTRI